MCTKLSKTIFVIWLACFVTGNLFAKTEIVDSKVSKVTIYQKQARVSREATISLDRGDYTIVFENLPIVSDATSFHASASGNSNPQILGLNHRVEEHLESQQNKVAEIEKEILDIEQGRQLVVDYRLAVLERKREFLLTILKQAGSTIPEEVFRNEMNTESWGEAYQFFGSNLGILSDSLRVFRLWSERIKDTLDIKRRELRALQASRGNQTREVQVNVRNESAGEVTIALDYLVSGAGWRPIYDARLNSGSKNIDLEMFAEIQQKTGEDWNDIKLILSTAVPTRTTGPGELGSWYISQLEPYYDVNDLLEQEPVVMTYSNPDGKIKVRGGRAGEVAYVVDGVRIGEPLGGYGPVNLGLSLTGSEVGFTNYIANFETSRKETVKSGELSSKVLLIKWNLESATELICRPRLNQSVFRQVKVTNQYDSPLLPGVVSLFAGSDFIGKTSLNNLIAPAQEFDLPFGVENRVEVKRKVISNKKNVYDDKIKTVQTIEIKLKNWSNMVGELTLEEAFPISQDNRIKVKHKDIDPKPDELDDSGKATWNLELQPGEEKTIQFTFEISYPKGLKLTGI